MKKLLFVLTVALSLTACGPGGPLVADTHLPFRAEYASSCDTESNIFIRTGDYTFTTNPWGKRGMVNFTNCIAGNTVVSGGVVGKINWDWVNLFTGVKSYPEKIGRAHV